MGQSHSEPMPKHVRASATVNSFANAKSKRKLNSTARACEGQYQSVVAPSQPPFKRAVHVERKTTNETPEKLLDHSTPDNFRLSFLRKLNYQKVWVPEADCRLPKHQTVIIFDWDDTLLCTTYLKDRDGQLNHPTMQRLLQNIAIASKALLEKALQMGNTFIITNAMDGWVEYSAKKYIPAVLPVLQKVRVISARTNYEDIYPHEVAKWKISAFLDVQRELDLPIITNLNSFGDSSYEMDATKAMGDEFSQALVKTVKFKEYPSPEELQKELDLVTQKFETIVENARNLKITLERKD